MSTNDNKFTLYELLYIYHKSKAGIKRLTSPSWAGGHKVNSTSRSASHADSQIDREARQAGRQAGRETDRQASRQADRLTMR